MSREEGLLVGASWEMGFTGSRQEKGFQVALFMNDDSMSNLQGQGYS